MYSQTVFEHNVELKLKFQGENAEHLFSLSTWVIGNMLHVLGFFFKFVKQFIHANNLSVR